MVPHDQALDAEPQEFTDPDLDGFFRVIADKQRRFVLYYLLEEQRSSVDELADELVRWMSDDNRPLSPLTRRDGIRIDLQHAHLPHLEDESLVTYDRNSGSVSLVTLPPTVESVLALAMGLDGADLDGPALQNDEWAVTPAGYDRTQESSRGGAR
jgi:hypothetical protein